MYFFLNWGIQKARFFAGFHKPWQVYIYNSYFLANAWWLAKDNLTSFYCSVRICRFAHKLKKLFSASISQNKSKNDEA